LAHETTSSGFVVHLSEFIITGNSKERLQAKLDGLEGLFFEDISEQPHQLHLLHDLQAMTRVIPKFSAKFAVDGENFAKLRKLDISLAVGPVHVMFTRAQIIALLAIWERLQSTYGAPLQSGK
jgi:hypothetical protein